ncbi:MAG: hypothetical protein BroJett011_23040 [Chloroflexota bacterium]|nr:MAG: hypothetical protein BroJett011_23040 [Chloroflexota bacterium]
MQTFILLAANDRSSLTQIRQHIEDRGGQTDHILPYQALIAKVPPQFLPQLITFPGIAGVYTQAVELATMDSYGPAARRFASAWNNLITPQPSLSGSSLLAEAQSSHQADTFTAPDVPAGKELSIASASVTPGYYQTSEYMAGSVAVGIVLIESNGAVDPSTENWTSDEKQLVFNEIMTALNWWATLEPKAQLSFVYDDHFSTPLPTRVEPITRPFTDQQYWISDAMKALGYNSTSYFTSVRNYDNALRTLYQTDWAFTIFVVDSSADADNHFKDGYFAYAYLGGPFLVLTYGNNGYGPSNMDAVAAHEVGHIFQALDQYGGATQACTRRSGYLNVENQNSQASGCLSNIDSIMRGQIYPYILGAIDPYAAGQIGWRDSDNDTILDPLDTQLTITLGEISRNERQITGSGTAQIIPYPSPNRTSVTINTLTGVNYRFNGGSWQPALATDGAFDETSETYHIISAPLEPGLHLLEVAAFDSAGNVSDPFVSSAVIIPNPLDPGPNTELYTPDNTVANQAFTLNGVAYHAQKGHIAQVEFRVNRGPWQPAQAQDGLFDDDYEPFIVSLNLPEAGTYLIETFATDTEGFVESDFARREIQVVQPLTTVFLPLLTNVP